MGGARTALFNWLFATKTGGTFVLRVDDTDPGRSSEESLRHILDALRWLGIDWDEGPEVGGPFGPYRQSERRGLYAARATDLIVQGKAYRCFCAPADLEEMRRRALAEGKPPRYDGRCSLLDEDESRRRAESGESFAVRLRVEPGRVLAVSDVVRGESRFDTSDLEDFVILRADGTATFLFAGAHDDAEMRITHVIRGEDLFSATPRQVLVFEALGAELPAFAHLPLIVGQDRQPLSKRHGDVSIRWYREAGFMPEALFNYLALLGWSPPGESEIVSKDELVACFELEKVGKTPAFFDVKKLEWMNNHYLQALPPEVVAERAIPFLAKAGLVSDPPSDQERELVEKLVPLVQVRMDRLDQIVEMTEFLFRTPSMESEDWKRVMSEPWAHEILAEMVEALDEIAESEWKKETIESELRGVAERKGIKPRVAFGPLRVAVSGRRVGPPLFESLEILGKDRVIRRSRAAMGLLEAMGPDLGPGSWPLDCAD